jgi:PTS system mannose-specific IIB component
VELARDPEKLLVLVRDVGALELARGAGLTADLAPTLNLGNVHYGAGRRPVTPSVFLAEPELRALRELTQAGFRVEARAIPSDPPVGLEEIERRYAAAP